MVGFKRHGRANFSLLRDEPQIYCSVFRIVLCDAVYFLRSSHLEKILTGEKRSRHHVTYLQITVEEVLGR